VLAIVELSLHRPTWTACAVAAIAAALDHEVRKNAMEPSCVVVTGCCELEEILSVLRRDIVPEFNNDGALVGFDRDLWVCHRARSVGELIVFERARELSASDDFCPKRQNHHALLYGSPAEPAFA